jgi:inorganic pyrophosphatase
MTWRKNNCVVGSLALVLTLVGTGCSKCGPCEAIGHAPELRSVDRYTLVGNRNFLTHFEPLDRDGHVHVVVEIPTGTNAKWEVDKETGHLAWELKKGKPRVVAYLGYPGNYGMVPRTMLPKELGGDGDPLDVLIVGPAIPRGTLVKARLLGVLLLLDDGEQDDKLIAVAVDSPLAGVQSIDDLNQQFNGITDILQLWFSNYKGPGRIVSRGFADAKQARKILDAAIAAFATQQ